MVVEQAPPLPLLIPGIAGVAGYNAFNFFRRRYPGQVIGTRRIDNWPLAGEGVEPCELHDRDSVARLFDRYQFASILNCEGTCKLKSCELDPALAQRVNVEMLATWCRRLAGRRRDWCTCRWIWFSRARPAVVTWKRTLRIR